MMQKQWAALILFMVTAEIACAQNSIGSLRKSVEGTPRQHRLTRTHERSHLEGDYEWQDDDNEDSVDFSGWGNPIGAIVSLPYSGPQFLLGDTGSQISRVGIGCGSAGEFIRPASRAGCQVLLTGEARFHTCLEAEALGIAMILPGHFASERFALETLATQLASEFSDTRIWASQQESDPLQWMDFDY